jgi:hypothetical protein
MFLSDIAAPLLARRGLDGVSRTDVPQLRARLCGGGDAPVPGVGTAGARLKELDYLSTMASTSRADKIRYSSPEYLTSVPPYLL